MCRYLSSIRHVRGSSLFSLLSPKPSFPSSASSRALASRYLPGSLQNDIEHVRGFSTSESDPSTFSTLGRDSKNTRSKNDADERSTRFLNLDSLRDRENMNSRSDNANKLDSWNDRFLRRPRSENAENGRSFNRESDARPFFMRDRENINSKSENDAETERSYRPMDFVRGVIDKDDNDMMQVYSRARFEKDADHVHIKMLRNNTFVTVTDSKGNIKLSGSAGSVKEMKAGQKLSRYAAEATAEVVGRRARGLGLKAVVMKVNGFTHFRRKRQAIMSWLEGFSESRADRSRNPIVHIEDTTRKPHNGCRLPKKRRI